jgi:hypothetical protein
LHVVLLLSLKLACNAVVKCDSFAWTVTVWNASAVYVTYTHTGCIIIRDQTCERRLCHIHAV